MPKQNFVNKIHPNTKTLYDAIDLSTRLHNYRQEDIGKALGIRQNTVSHHLKNHSFDQDQINELLDFLELEIKVEVKVEIKACEKR